MNNKRWALFSVLIVLAIACVVGAFRLGAASPATGTITLVSEPVTWNGTAALGVSATGETTCVEQPGVHVNCDTFTLTVTGTPQDWAGKEVQIDISWVVLASDYDLYVHRNSNAGPIVAQSVTSDLGTNEIVSIQPEDLEADGTTVLSVHVVYSIAVAGDQYLGVARVIADPGDSTQVPVTKSRNWKINYHGQCCEGNLSAAGNNTYVLLPVLINGNKIKRSTDGGQTWVETYPPAPASFPFGIEGDMQAFGSDAIFFGTELADAVVARSTDGGSTWLTTQAPLASGGNDQAWAYLGPFNDLRPGGRLPTDEDYVLAGWMRIGSAIAFSFDGGITFTAQTPLPGGGASGPEHVVCHENATDPPNPAPGDTRVPNPLFANQKAGRHGTWGTDRRFYWTETLREEDDSGDRYLYVCQTADFGVTWTGTKHLIPPNPGVGFSVSHSAFDNNGTFYVLHGNKLYVSFDQGRTFAFTHTLPRYGNAARADLGSDQYFVVDCGTIHIGLQEDAGGNRGRIIYLRGTRVDTANPTWDYEVVDEVGFVRLDFMYIVLDGNDVPTISYTTPPVGPAPLPPNPDTRPPRQVTTASRNAPMVALGGNTCGLVSVSAVSRKVHAPNKVLDIPLSLNGPPGIECRTGGGANLDSHQVVVKFGEAASLTGVVVTPETGKTAEVDGTPALNGAGTELTINLRNVSDAQTLTITLQNVVTAGGAATNLPFQVMYLAGDTNEDTRVNVGDTNQTKGNSGKLTDSFNFRTDVNVDGRINVGDTNFVKAHAGASEPTRPLGQRETRR
jgi:hypothetical protein